MVIQGVNYAGSIPVGSTMSLKKPNMTTSVNPDFERARCQLIDLTSRFDIKGISSGQFYICKEGKWVDIVGIFLKEQGYEADPVSSEYLVTPNKATPYLGKRARGAYAVAAWELNNQLKGLYEEIDRHASTNKTIRAHIHKLFGMVDHNPESCHPG